MDEMSLQFGKCPHATKSPDATKSPHPGPPPQAQGNRRWILPAYCIVL
jgi:hypothetical protein